MACIFHETVNPVFFITLNMPFHNMTVLQNSVDPSLGRINETLFK